MFPNIVPELISPDRFSADAEVPVFQLDGTYAGSKNCETRDIGCLDFLSDYCVFDWVASEQLTPRVPSGQTLVSAGTRIETDPGFHALPDGDDLWHASHEPGILSVDVPDLITFNGTDDMVVIHAGYTNDTRGATVMYGFGLYPTSANNLIEPAFAIVDYSGGSYAWSVDGAGSKLVGATNFGYRVVIGVRDSDGNTFAYLNGVKSGSTPATGSLSSNSNIVPSIGINVATRESRHCFCYGAIGTGIADLMTDAKALEISNAIAGLNARIGTDGTFARASSSSAVVNSKIYLLGTNTAASGTSEGVVFDKAITNKAYRNINPQNTTGWSVRSGCLATLIADDSTDLRSAGTVDCNDLGPSVIKLENPGAANAFAFLGAASGNTNKHSLQIRCKVVTGSAPDLGSYCDTGSTFANGVTCNDNYELTENENITPQSATAYIAVQVPAFSSCYVIGAQYEENGYCSAMIPNKATGATAARAANTLDTGVTLQDAKGRIEFEIKFEKDPENNLYIMCGGVSSTYPFVVNSSKNNIMYDGTNTLTETTDIVTDRAWHKVACSWHAASSIMKLRVDGATTTQTYDGAWTGTTIQTSFVGRGYYRVRNIKIFEEAL